MSIKCDQIEFFGNGKTLSEAKDFVMLAVIEHLTKKQLGVNIPKMFPLGFPWKEKVRGNFLSE